MAYRQPRQENEAIPEMDTSPRPMDDDRIHGGSDEEIRDVGDDDDFDDTEDVDEEEEGEEEDEGGI